MTEPPKYPTEAEVEASFRAAVDAGRVVAIPHNGERYFLFRPLAQAVARATSRRFVAMVAGEIDGQPCVTVELQGEGFEHELYRITGTDAVQHGSLASALGFAIAHNRRLKGEA